MVKNTTGGSGHKAFARKLVTNTKSNSIRLSQNTSELYGTIIKHYGNGMCQVKTQNNTELTCHIRGKFRGRNKKQNLVSINSTVLVGLREWENPAKNCDLLEIYDHEQLHLLPFTSQIANTSTSDDNIIFSDSDPNVLFDKKKLVVIKETDVDNEIDINDI